jgi:phage shock protein E
MANMKWTGLLLIGGVIAVAFALKAAPKISINAAREHLKNGALLVDVRTVQEFKARQLTNAVNLPLDELKNTLPSRVPDKSKTLLFYCRSGRRSGIAEGQSRALGYTNSISIGSYEQAKKIVNGGAQ